GMAVVPVTVLVLGTLLRIPGLPAAERGTGGPSLASIVRQPAFRVALIASVFGYAVMTITMSATPLAMQACGFTFFDSASVIQMHMVGMFLPSFFTGHLIVRFGVIPVIAAGGLLEFAGAAVDLAGVGVAQLWGRNSVGGVGA